jgi:hypothetical protein
MVESEALNRHIKEFSHYGEIETSVKIERQHQMLLFEVHGAGVLLIQHHQCFHQDRNCDQPKK